jgi:hypothetical protein
MRDTYSRLEDMNGLNGHTVQAGTNELLFILQFFLITVGYSVHWLLLVVFLENLGGTVDILEVDDFRGLAFGSLALGDVDAVGRSDRLGNRSNWGNRRGILSLSRTARLRDRVLGSGGRRLLDRGEPLSVHDTLHESLIDPFIRRPEAVTHQLDTGFPNFLEGCTHGRYTKDVSMCWSGYRVNGDTLFWSPDRG